MNVNQNQTAASRTSNIHKNELKALLDDDDAADATRSNSTKESEMLALSSGASSGSARKVESDYHLQRYNRMLSPGIFVFKQHLLTY